jgi:large subunit ribosomal protein L10
LAITKEKKREMVADYAAKMSASQAMILADYRGLTVADLTDLRQRLREVDGTFQVVKNTLFQRTLDEAGITLPAEELLGPIAVGYCQGEVPPVAKALADFAKETQNLRIKGAVLGADFLDAAGVTALAALPPREFLLAQLVGAVQGPMSSLASTLAAPLRELAQVLQARAEQGQEAAA